MTNTCARGIQDGEGPNAPISCSALTEKVDDQNIRKPCPFSRDGRIQRMCGMYEKK